jgi:hypothetical protein
MPKEVRVRVPTPDDVLPSEFRKHILQAYKEFLLALRSLIDEHVKRVEEFESVISEEKKEIKKINIQ